MGSEEGCEWRLEDESVSPRHARVWLEADRILVEDAGGGRGTLVNGYDISGQVEVEYPAWVTVGGAVLTIALEGEVIPERPKEAPKESPKEAHLMGLTFLGSAGMQFLQGQSAGVGGVEGIRHASTEVQYRLEKEIAQGGMGLIYQSEDPQLERVVAVKVSRASRGKDPRFANEAKILAHLAHPNIVPIYSMGCDEQGYPFYSMKLVRGLTLQSILDGLSEGDVALHEQYRLPRMLSIFIAVCNAIEFAHSKGVLHRDLKPDNVMVGEFGEVLVMDWGIAKFLSEQELEDSIERRAVGEEGEEGVSRRPSVDFGTTLEGEVMGTPQFMAPEQARGRVYELDERADLYSLGAILYAILTLRPPVVAGSLEKLLEKVRSGAIEPMVPFRDFPKTSEGKVREAWPRALGIPDALHAVVGKAMALQPEDRYASVKSLRMDIEAYLSGYATAAEEAGPLRQLYLLMKRHWVASLSVVVFLLSGGVFMLKLAASERAADRSARLARERAAFAQISLAEAAERDVDGEEMERLLAEVPEDLRDQKWEYLSRKLHSEQRTIVAKGGQPWLAVAPHPKQKGVLVTLQMDGWVRLVDLSSGVTKDLWKAREIGFGEAMALSPDGLRVALIRSSRETKRVPSSHVEVFELGSGKRVFGIRMPSRSGFRLVFDPEGKRLLCESRDLANNHQNVQLWDIASEKLLWERNPVGAALAEFSRSGKTMRVFLEKSGTEELDVATGQPIGDLARVAFPSGVPGTGAAQWFYAATSDGSAVFTFQNRPARFLRRIETETGRVVFENRISEIKGLDYLQDTGTLVTLATRSDRCAVLQFWHGQSGLLLKSIPVVGRLKAGWKLSLHPESGYVGVINGGEMRVWKFELASPVRRFYAGVGKFGFLQDSRFAVRLGSSGQQGAIEVLDLKEREPDKKSFTSTPVLGSQVGLITRDRSGVLMAASGNPTQIFRASAGKLERLARVEAPVLGSHFQLSPSGVSLWTGAAICDAASGAERCRVDRDGVEIPLSVGGASRWLDEERVAEIALVRKSEEEESFERAILIWDAAGGTRALKMEAPDADALEVSPDGSQLAEAGGDMRLRIRNAWTLEVEREFRAHDGALTAVAWHPQKPLLVTAADDLTVRVWSLPEGRLVEELRGFASQPEQYPQSLAISPDGKGLMIQSESGVGLYEPRSFQGAKESALGRSARP